MDLASYRKSQGLTQEGCAMALGVISKGYISEIERGLRPASLKLALKVERWSGGEVKAASICPAAAQIDEQEAA